MMQVFKEILAKFASVPKEKARTTIFSITRYPHYENVASNVLAFYFNTRQEHNLSDLLVSSLLQCVDIDCSCCLETNDVHREYYTENNGQIDLVLDMPTRCICIENKIFASLYNDLDGYQKTIEHNFGIKDKIFIVLSLYKIEIPLNSSFKNVTYGDLWCKVRGRIGKYLESADPKWLAILLDFMAETEKMGVKKMQLTDQDKFIIENEDEVKKLLEAQRELLDKLSHEVYCIKNSLEKEAPFSQATRQWIHKQRCLVYDYVLSSHKVAFDLWLNPSGWKFIVFERNVPTFGSYVHELYKNHIENHVKWEIHDDRYVACSFALLINLDSIKDEIKKQIQWVLKADEEYQKNI